jgi:hypothetical protein
MNQDDSREAESLVEEAAEFNNPPKPPITHMPTITSSCIISFSSLIPSTSSSSRKGVVSRRKKCSPERRNWS